MQKPSPALSRISLSGASRSLLFALSWFQFSRISGKRQHMVDICSRERKIGQAIISQHFPTRYTFWTLSGPDSAIWLVKKNHTCLSIFLYIATSSRGTNHQVVMSDRDCTRSPLGLWDSVMRGTWGVGPPSPQNITCLLAVSIGLCLSGWEATPDIHLSAQILSMYLWTFYLYPILIKRIILKFTDSSLSGVVTCKCTVLL